MSKTAVRKITDPLTLFEWIEGRAEAGDPEGRFTIANVENWRRATITEDHNHSSDEDEYIAETADITDYVTSNEFLIRRENDRWLEKIFAGETITMALAIIYLLPAAGLRELVKMAMESEETMCFKSMPRLTRELGVRFKVRVPMTWYLELP
ncbi:hypothetical protein LB557_17345 [Mesorhizobium sp. BR115XR7A]|uniref:hypothetical protein n=1 Tax=Mesorhizobium sp. BR115XR7A TaxID=2876645 RepID=UPI001CCDC515|nr:hypothetical protein [Mesorhizobium sp. BR115XR7A]MBZ9907775.1 hypothetical protein [Mesorhizobium sp. BR115XR7A]MBZ9930424.1 hypothetical protein [Mesorhizobium sp. BR1-1-5]